ncbi:MAG: metallophosphoesterase [Stenotrophomonas sp.]
MKTAWTFIWHFLVVLLVLAIVAAGFGLTQGANFYYGETEAAYKAGGEGPHVFRQGDQWVSQTLRGTGKQGFRVEERRHALAEPFPLMVNFPLDQSRFSVQATPQFDTPPSRYQDDQPILAISDIEGNYKAFRDFLITSKVIDADLNWTFRKQHLVLVGDFVDRGSSVTQVLWLIYKLEQSAAQAGGQVHYILGNHEIKNLQGDFQSAHKKYSGVAAILGRQQSELFGEDAFLGRWLASKNTVEVVNGILFVHGGLHPGLAQRPWSLDDLNRIVRSQYRMVWYPKQAPGSEDFLIDPKTGPSWYRGYFKEDLSQAQVEKTLAKFDAKAVVVGHTLNWSVKTLFDGKVFAIDVKHPSDYRSSIPPRSSEGLWLEGGSAWRVLEDGSREAL